MELGVILPSGIPGVDGRLVLEWARRAEQSGVFSIVAAADRFNYDNFDALTTLAAVAGATETVRLMSYVTVAPLRAPAVFAKEVATLARLAPGRVSIGVGVGARPSDYEAAGVSWEDRGPAMDRALEALQSLRSRPDDEQILGPSAEGIEVLIGGTSPPALRRLVSYGDGFVHGGLIADIFSGQSAAVRGTWQGAGRDGTPKVIGSTWVASSTTPGDAADRWLEAYFVQGGPPAEIRDTISRGAESVRATVADYAARGADACILFPCVSELSELEFLVQTLR